MGKHFYIDLWNTINKGMITAIEDQKDGIRLLFYGTEVHFFTNIEQPNMCLVS